jgi:hypothetical protein
VKAEISAKKFGRFSTQHGGAPQQTGLKNKYAEIMKEPVPRS